MKILHALVLACTTLAAIGAHSQPAGDSTLQFSVQGSCVQCKQRIEKAASLPGVLSASWPVDSKMLTVTFRSAVVSSYQIQHAIALAGHDNAGEQADSTAYASLPDCCRYREITEAPYAFSDSTGAHITGIVMEQRNGVVHPLAGATILWLGTNKGVKSNVHGEFVLPKMGGDARLVISYAGYKPDTVLTNGLENLEISLNRTNDLTQVVITARRRSSYIEMNNPFRTAIITRKELLKAACCNLSESFETNPAVDVSYNDAATGTRQIQLLGLAGIYTQLTVENLPGLRGLATPLGLNSIAGPWIESIQLIKGTGSVVNGFESIAGQINVELRKPQNSEKIYLNGYVNSIGKTDINLNWSHRINKEWSTGLLLHNDFLYTKTDFDQDGFRDLPTGDQFNLVHRWQYMGENGWFSQFGVKLLIDDKTGGQMAYRRIADKFSRQVYGLGFRTRRYEMFAKTGYVFPARAWQSIGLQLSAFDHRQDAWFGLREYDARQKNGYANLIFQTRLSSDQHVFKTGASMAYDQYHEFLSGRDYDRKEIVPGAFAEYTYHPSARFDLVAGLRADHNNLSGWFATPRLNIRYAFTPQTTLRLAVGRGQRTANQFAENIGVLASSRTIQIIGAQPGYAYGLQPEVAWNKGISLDHKWKLWNRDASVGIDFYRNDFVNQVVVDVEDPRTVKFYNLDGSSFSNSFQVEWNSQPAEELELRLAYRYFDVRTSYQGIQKQKPLTAAHRAFLNLAYGVDGWDFDWTVNFTGPKRIPSTSDNPEEYQLPERSPAFITMGVQISRALGEKKVWELYVGAENLTNYFQKGAILAAEQPFSDHFDASLIWGPISNRLIYGGFRLRVK